MNKERLYSIMKEPHTHDVYYEEKVVWIQEVKDNIATIGFMDGSEEKDVYIEDLYESNLYNDGINKPN